MLLRRLAKKIYALGGKKKKDFDLTCTKKNLASLKIQPPPPPHNHHFSNGLSLRIRYGLLQPLYEYVEIN